MPVTRGQKLSITAAQWNDVLATTAAVKTLLLQSGNRIQRNALPTGVVYGVPSKDFSVGEVGAIADFVQPPRTRLPSFSEFALSVSPAVADEPRPVCVAVEPVSAGQVGRFQVSDCVVAIHSSFDTVAFTDANPCAVPAGDGGLRLAPSGLKVLGAREDILLVSLDGRAVATAGTGGDAPGQFACRVYEVNGAWYIDCYDSALPEWDKAGVATVNLQQFDVSRGHSALQGATEARVYLRYVAPVEETDEQEAADAFCDLRLFLDPTATVVESTPTVVWYLIAVARKRWDTRGVPFYQLDQAHTPGPITLQWYGECTDLLKETLETGA